MAEQNIYANMKKIEGTRFCLGRFEILTNYNFFVSYFIEK